MSKQNPIIKKHMEREQGDINTTSQRKEYWQKNIKGETKKWLEADNKYFLHQSLSTPVLNVMAKAYGIYIEDLNRKKYIESI